MKVRIITGTVYPKNILQDKYIHNIIHENRFTCLDATLFTKKAKEVQFYHLAF